MPVSKGKMFAQLYQKEMREILPEIILVVIITILLDGWLSIRFQDGPAKNIIFLPVILTIGLAGFIPILTSFKMLSSEWSHNTVYLLMSLPVSGAMILGAKLLAVFTQMIIGTAVAMGAGILIIVNVFPQGWQQISAYPDLISGVTRIGAVPLIAFVFVCCVSFLSQIVGRLTRKHSGIVTFGTFIIILYLVNKITELVGGRYEMMDKLVPTQALPDAFFNVVNAYSLEYLLIAAILFAGAVWLYDKKLEL